MCLGRPKTPKPPKPSPPPLPAPPPAPPARAPLPLPKTAPKAPLDFLEKREPAEITAQTTSRKKVARGTAKLKIKKPGTGGVNPQQPTAPAAPVNVPKPTR